MGCTIKIKGKEEFKIFSTEAEARQYIVDNNVKIEEVVDPKTKKPVSYITSVTSHESVVNTIRTANNISWEYTKNLITQTRLNDWDIEEYGRTSDAISLSEFLSELRVQDKDTLKDCSLNLLLIII